MTSNIMVVFKDKLFNQIVQQNLWKSFVKLKNRWKQVNVRINEQALLKAVYLSRIAVILYYDPFHYEIRIHHACAKC